MCSLHSELSSALELLVTPCALEIVIRNKHLQRLATSHRRRHKFKDFRDLHDVYSRRRLRHHIKLCLLLPGFHRHPERPRVVPRRQALLAHQRLRGENGDLDVLLLEMHLPVGDEYQLRRRLPARDDRRAHVELELLAEVHELRQRRPRPLGEGAERLEEARRVSIEQILPVVAEENTLVVRLVQGHDDGASRASGSRAAARGVGGHKAELAEAHARRKAHDFRP
mmetsp:Transcript_8031/g.22918  ORF Transcript_8031/g.22918 Transcript_8031/m.22918 type:complete len:225 (+) Transcript_8031:707-1381(+)